MQGLGFKCGSVSNKVYQLYVSVIIALLFYLNYLLNEVINGDLVTLVIWGLFLILMYVRDIKFLLKYSYILFMQCSNILGIYICENKILWLTELGRYSEPFGSLLLATVSHWVFFLSLWLLETHLKDITQIKAFCVNSFNKKILRYIGIFILLVAIVAFLHSVNNPAFSLGLDRFRYSEMYLQGVWKYPDKILGLSIPLIGILYIFGFKKVSIVVLIFYSSYLFCIGNKFGGFLNLFFLSVPAVYALNKSEKVLKKTFAVGVAVSVLMVGIVFFHNYLTYGHGLGKNFTYLEQRFAQQGQLWWAQYGKEKDSGYKVAELEDEFRTYFVLEKQPKEEWNHGIYKVMRNVTPPGIYIRTISGGSRFASATLASIYYYFKDIGLVIGNVLLALIFWIVTTCYYNDYASGDVLSTIISGRFFVWMHMVATQADFDIIFSFKALLGIFVYVGYKVLVRLFNTHKGIFKVVKNFK